MIWQSVCRSYSPELTSECSQVCRLVSDGRDRGGCWLAGGAGQFDSPDKRNQSDVSPAPLV